MKTLLVTLTLAGSLLAQAPFQVKVNGHGPSMILIPGYDCPGAVWDGTVDHYKNQYEMHVLSLAGFAGVPRVPGPFLATAREGIADYIRKNKLDHPVIVGHSLGGYLALDIAVHYPDLTGKLVIVDAYPMMAAVVDPTADEEKAKKMVEQMRTGMASMNQDMYERMIKSGMSVRPMVTSDSDLDRLVDWGLKSDRSAGLDAMTELFAADIRADLTKIKSPVLVLGAWVGYKDYGADHAGTVNGIRSQYSKVADLQFAVTDTARHFIMWDDPKWMFEQTDRFLKSAQTVPVQ